MHAGDMGGWWMLWGGLMMVLFWGVIIGLIVWAVQAATRRDRRDGEPGLRPSTHRPVDIAGERYARGDISREEYERIVADLEHAPLSKLKV